MSRFLTCLSFAALLTLTPFLAQAQNAQEILAQFSHEPTVEATQEAALEYAGIGSDRLESLYTRAGIANILPRNARYTLSYNDRDLNRPQSISRFDGSNTALSKEDRVYKEDLTELKHQGLVQWDLSRLIFNAEQVRVYNQMNSSSKTRDQLLARVTKTYFARRKLQADMLVNPAKSVSDQLKRELQLQELTAQLDASTGGWFSEELRKSKR